MFSNHRYPQNGSVCANGGTYGNEYASVDDAARASAEMHWSAWTGILGVVCGALPQMLAESKLADQRQDAGHVAQVGNPDCQY